MAYDGSKTLFVDLNFGKIGNYRIVDAPDVNGVVRRSVLLPLDAYGIRLTPDNVPFWLLSLQKTKKMKALYRVVPYITADMHEKMLREGLADPNNMCWMSDVGRVVLGYKGLLWGKKEEE